MMNEKKELWFMCALSIRTTDPEIASILNCIDKLKEAEK